MTMRWHSAGRRRWAVGSRRGTAALAVWLAAGVAAAGVAAAEAPQVLARYVVMAHSDVLGRTVPLVRVVVAQPGGCPAVALSSGRQLALTARANPDPGAFGVGVCEAVADLPAGVTATLAGETQVLPVPASLAVKTAAVLGDSGCKDSGKQDCKTEWPLPGIAAAAAARRPDLVIHVGDYNYRGTPNKTLEDQWSYDGCLPQDGGAGLVRQSALDTWPTWSADFFVPMQPLLEAAPWVMVRGNHELCSRAGRGYFFFLSPHSPLLNPWVRQPACDAGTEPTEPYRLRFDNLDLVVLDTADACGGESPQSAQGTAYEVDLFMRQLAVANALVTPGRPAWLLGHRPIWSLGVEEAGAAPASQNLTLQAALRATPEGRLAEPYRLVLSGHMHQFYTATFDATRPPQLVIGQSGVKLSTNRLPSPYSGKIDGLAATGLSAASGAVYGYLWADIKDGANWTGTLPAFDAAGTPQAAPLAQCALPVTGGQVCR